ncbi:alpha-E domain-containing protein [Breoghania sp.]|uniref:alpha-E domain-containing protein n=1 Tax=Breoghania sp. TaxID=2065378 RepID=UPI002AA764DE|nr:alpha-E domain-containing protein [Breoghania sp.]
MLGRTASSLFWLSRYVERSEDMARLVDVGYRISLLPGVGNGGHREDWKSTLVSAGCEGGFFDLYDEMNEKNVVNYMLFDENNPSSVRSCLRTARDNARSVRTAITREMWESLNTTWIEFSDIKPHHMTRNKLPTLLDWIKERSMLFRGAMLGSILRNDTFHFSQLGAFVERADNTSRILDVKYHLLLPQTEMIGGGMDNYQWSTILRSVSAHRNYRWIYKDNRPKPWNVAEFLILRREMPRSLIHCYSWLTQSTSGIEQLYGERTPSIDITEQTYKTLREGDMTTIFADGLHEFLQNFIACNNELTMSLASDYNFA